MHSYDVAVIGGGSTGFAAAIAAARGGARTALVEYNSFIGGNSAVIPGWLGFHNRSGDRVVGGIALSCVEELRQRKAATDFYLDPICGSVVGINTGHWKIYALEKLREAGIDVWLQSPVTGIETDKSCSGNKSRISRLRLFSRGKEVILKAKSFVDSTDSGIIARMAGADMYPGREKDSEAQVCSWPFYVTGIEFEKLFVYLKQNPYQLRPFKIDSPEKIVSRAVESDVFVMGAFEALIRKAGNDGMNLPGAYMPGIAFPCENKMFSVATRVRMRFDENGLAAAEMETEGATQTLEWLKFLRNYVPGFANCVLSATPHQIGVRESYHLRGMYHLTADDLTAGRNFEDAIASGAYHLDIHSPDHNGLDTQDSGTYQIPLRSLRPVSVSNLLIAGRCISATHEAAASIRVIPISMAVGEAAGAACALAAKTGKGEIDTVDAFALQENLLSNGAVLGKALDHVIA